MKHQHFKLLLSVKYKYLKNTTQQHQPQPTLVLTPPTPHNDTGVKKKEKTFFSPGALCLRKAVAETVLVDHQIWRCFLVNLPPR